MSIELVMLSTHLILCVKSMRNLCSSVLGFPGGASGKEICLPMQEKQAPSLGGEDSLGEGMATHSRLIAWRILHILQGFLHSQENAGYFGINKVYFAGVSIL